MVRRRGPQRSGACRRRTARPVRHVRIVGAHDRERSALGPARGGSRCRAVADLAAGRQSAGGRRRGARGAHRGPSVGLPGVRGRAHGGSWRRASPGPRQRGRGDDSARRGGLCVGGGTTAGWLRDHAVCLRPRVLSARIAGDARGRCVLAGWLEQLEERRGRDSNPRCRFTPHDGLANRYLQPLGHLSQLSPTTISGRPTRPFGRQHARTGTTTNKTAVTPRVFIVPAGPGGPRPLRYASRGPAPGSHHASAHAIPPRPSGQGYRQRLAVPNVRKLRLVQDPGRGRMRVRSANRHRRAGDCAPGM